MRITAVVTGATGGLGKEITRGLLREGATVIIGVRDARKGDALRAELDNEPGGGRVEVLPLDLASMTSVCDFSAAISAAHPKVHLLVNNAGAWFNELRRTPEGHEMTLATNVLGPYLLTHLLLPLLHAGTPSRIVNIVSSATGSYDAKDLDWERRKYGGFKAYTQSKQAVRMMTWTLAQRLQGTGVVANAVSPGFVKTDFLGRATGLVATMLRLMTVFAVTPQKGAETPLWVALTPELETSNGKYFESLKEKNSGFREQAQLAELDRLLGKMTLSVQ